MRLKRFAAPLVATLMFGLIQGVAVAQLVNDIDADVPFSFTVGNTTLASGKYVFHALDPETLEIRGTAGHATVIHPTIQAEIEAEPKDSELVFQRFGTQEFLYQVFLEGNRFGVELEPSKAQRDFEAKGQMGVQHTHPGKMHKDKKNRS